MTIKTYEIEVVKRLRPLFPEYKPTEYNHRKIDTSSDTIQELDAMFFILYSFLERFKDPEIAQEAYEDEVSTIDRKIEIARNLAECGYLTKYESYMIIDRLEQYAEDL